MSRLVDSLDEIYAHRYVRKGEIVEIAVYHRTVHENLAHKLEISAESLEGGLVKYIDMGFVGRSLDNPGWVEVYGRSSHFDYPKTEDPYYEQLKQATIDILRRTYPQDTFIRGYDM